MNCIDCSYSLIKDGHYNCTYEERECIKISVLEKENAELKEDLRNKKLAIQNRKGRIEELEKENEELKEKQKWLGSSTKCWFRNAPCRSCDEHDERLRRLGLCYIGQLDKAKDIVRELLNSCFGYNSKTVNYEVKVKAEQFLNSEVSE